MSSLEQRNQQIEERRCPLISWQQIVECRSCGSPNFNFDVGAPTRRNWIQGSCDDCGGRRGIRVQPKKPN